MLNTMKKNETATKEQEVATDVEAMEKTPTDQASSWAITTKMSEIATHYKVEWAPNYTEEKKMDMPTVPSVDGAVPGAGALPFAVAWPVQDGEERYDAYENKVKAQNKTDDIDGDGRTLLQEHRTPRSGRPTANFKIEKTEENLFKVLLTQGKKQTQKELGVYATENEAFAAATDAMNPPCWEFDQTYCATCLLRFGLFNWPRHCRCCGRMFCTSCANQSWPASMFLPTYCGNDGEINSHVCQECAETNKTFFRKVHSGELDAAKRIYEKGYVNVHSPDLEGNYAVHRAIEANSIPLLEWLVLELNCDARVSSCQNGSEVTSMILAAKHADRSVLDFLVGQKCSFSDIDSLDACHILLDKLYFGDSLVRGDQHT